MSNVDTKTAKGVADDFNQILPFNQIPENNLQQSGKWCSAMLNSRLYFFFFCPTSRFHAPKW
jgi:hypothetical protein